MREVAKTLLFGAFMGLLAYVSADHLFEAYQTGQFTMHRKMPFGPDFVTFSSDPTGFLIELCLYLFLLVMGAFGVLVACRDILFAVTGPLDFFDLRYAYQAINILNLILTLFFLIVLTYGVIQRFV